MIRTCRWWFPLRRRRFARCCAFAAVVVVLAFSSHYYHRGGGLFLLPSPRRLGIRNNAVTRTFLHCVPIEKSATRSHQITTEKIQTIGVSIRGGSTFGVVVGKMRSQRKIGRTLLGEFSLERSS
jgi:hypothetical protein